MKCPSCHKELAAPLPQCAACGANLRQLDVKFGAVPRHSYLLTDAAQRLTPKQMRDVTATLRLFHHKFPQSLFSVFLLSEVIRGTISEYTFWIANRARFGEADLIGTANFDLLLGIDVTARTASLAIGYGLEAYLTEHDLEVALAAGASAFHAGNFAEGIRLCVDSIMNRMRDLARRLEGQTLLAEPAAVASLASLPMIATVYEAPEPTPLGWKVAIVASAVLVTAIVLYFSIRRWLFSNLFDREYRFPAVPEIPHRLGGIRCGGCMATIDFR